MAGGGGGMEGGSRVYKGKDKHARDTNSNHADIIGSEHRSKVKTSQLV